MSELEVERFIVFMVLTAICLTPIHEAGHYITAKILGMEILETELYPNPHVTALNADSNRTVTTLFLLGGFLFLPVTIIAYSLIVGKIYSLELIYLTIVSVLGSQTDFLNILKLYL